MSNTDPLTVPSRRFAKRSSAPFPFALVLGAIGWMVLTGAPVLGFLLIVAAGACLTLGLMRMADRLDELHALHGAHVYRDDLS